MLRLTLRGQRPAWTRAGVGLALVTVLTMSSVGCSHKVEIVSARSTFNFDVGGEKTTLVRGLMVHVHLREHGTGSGAITFSLSSATKDVWWSLVPVDQIEPLPPPGTGGRYSGDDPLPGTLPLPRQCEQEGCDIPLTLVLRWIGQPGTSTRFSAEALLQAEPGGSEVAIPADVDLSIVRYQSLDRDSIAAAVSAEISRATGMRELEFLRMHVPSVLVSAARGRLVSASISYCGPGDRFGVYIVDDALFKNGGCELGIEWLDLCQPTGDCDLIFEPAIETVPSGDGWTVRVRLESILPDDALPNVPITLELGKRD